MTRNPDTDMDVHLTAATTAKCTAMDEAIDRALEAVRENGKAGIAASVLRHGRIIATGENEVHLQADPTKNAEMVAITRAATVLETTDLSDCVLVPPCSLARCVWQRSGSPAFRA